MDFISSNNWRSEERIESATYALFDENQSPVLLTVKMVSTPFQILDRTRSKPPMVKQKSEVWK